MHLGKDTLLAWSTHRWMDFCKRPTQPGEGGSVSSGQEILDPRPLEHGEKEGCGIWRSTSSGEGQGQTQGSGCSGPGTGAPLAQI